MAIELLLSHPSLMDNLRKASHGNYGIILSLLGCLDNGLIVKRLVDRVIDSCVTFLFDVRHLSLTGYSIGDHVVNLREDILLHRVKFSLTTMEDKQREVHLDRAAKSLEH
jgi:hypothetical protein